MASILTRHSNRRTDTEPAVDPSLPTQTFRRARTLPFFGDSLRNSAVGGAHFGGVDPVKERRLSTLQHRHSHPPVRNSLVGAGLEPRAEEVHAAVLADLKELFEGRPTAEIFERRFARKAVFEDPFVLCKGVHEVAPQFFSLSHVVAKATTLSRRVLSLPSERDCLIFAQKQEYVMRITGLRKVIESIVRVELDEGGRITRLVDEWHGRPLSSHWAATALRRLHALIVPFVPWLASAPE
ncbi:hypothetical protein K488DRAFT_55941 [Vararia minispora EC-137]|uniref:Uncharacterized protein n=1 Tax=Vararia minispora EC-137 TaxID=1314806 RepID=A0ACB8QDC9_9AGAM|nr:hypothetical protein K488DRAFT_55941 [Vararia minispora EC-137]